MFWLNCEKYTKYVFSKTAFITDEDGNGGCRVYIAVCLSIYPHDIRKIDAARIIKHGI